MDDRSRTVRVTTGARLHFGLFDTRAPFGGVGMMTDQPQTGVTVSSAERFDPGDFAVDRITGIAARALAWAARAGMRVEQTARSAGGDLPSCQVRVEFAAPAHFGFGSGTQLALAVATGIGHWLGIAPSRAEFVSEIGGRGRRSAIGSIGFFEGGLLFEDGCPADEAGFMLSERAEPPAAWRVLLVRPEASDTLVCGESEQRAFTDLPAAEPSVRADLRVRGLELIEACRRGDFARFAAGLTEFNRLSGELFAPLQGGPYHGDRVARLIRLLRDCGGAGYGQSSWGPTVFAICEDEGSAQVLAERMRLGDPSAVIQIVCPARRGARIEG